MNREISAREVLIIDENGVKLGTLPTAEGIRMAEERMLDLVEVAPQATPPVCRILDYGMYRYQLQKKKKTSENKSPDAERMKIVRRSTNTTTIFKVRAIKSFLEDGHRVKVSVFFRGRRDVLP